ncbi:uncharacterized protein FIBRA_08916 [Fibroporia radiculosa]|uniref:Zn(2)-C6 fungal-type domain-containing protein n=1 Tax=Fibroporia radiculosa TaxID=599839 RepID=J4GXM2_9APHY|nr:uncharacterized protein FIBRA_08916 [Fibroporia radiculosa]CCM06635.1 predicted protein [Fibroporia radiculosa]
MVLPEIMADKSSVSTPSAGSPSPDSESFSDIPSSNASPVSAPPSLYMTPTPDGRDPHDSLLDSRPRPNPDVARSHSAAGKGGCWTCRLRRKKCDEEREDDNGACRTCRRLGIECLGWGVKRPDWMRDKEKVAAYKAHITEDLNRKGLIRGRPRAAYMSPAPLAHPHASAVAGPGPSSARFSGARDSPYQRPPPSSRPRPPPVSMPGFPTGPRAGGSPSYAMTMNPLTPLHDAFHAAQAYVYPTTLSPTIPIPHGDDPTAYDSTYFPQGAATAVPTMSHEQYMVYYFQSVRKTQYVFAGNSLTNALHSIVTAEPRGPTANAICALSSLHYFRTRVAQGLDAHAAEPEIAKEYYEHAHYQLVNTKSLHGQYCETDAVAAVLLVSYALLSAVPYDWSSELEVAYSWLTSTRIHEEQNPKLMLLNMTVICQFAARATMVRLTLYLFGLPANPTRTSLAVDRRCVEHYVYTAAAVPVALPQALRGRRRLLGWHTALRRADGDTNWMSGRGGTCDRGGVRTGILEGYRATER